MLGGCFFALFLLRFFIAVLEWNGYLFRHFNMNVFKILVDTWSLLLLNIVCLSSAVDESLRSFTRCRGG